ncbi:MAG: hypothetical protein PF693_03010 [Spirochaetia bacterium]|nr:hypothetical protein [Spirochaetia bacterium]
MELKFFRNVDEGEFSVKIMDDRQETDFDYIKFIDSLYKNIDSISAVFDESVTEEEESEINSLLGDIKNALGKD